MSARAALLLIAVLAVLAPACGREPGPDPLPDPENLRVITYNVQFLPGIASKYNLRPDARHRAGRIAKEVAGYDLIALQETFDKRRRKQIVEGVTKAWGGHANILESPLPEGFVTNGGCLLLTRRPILETHSIVFSKYSTLEEYGLHADGSAAKGVIHARVAFSGGRRDTFLDVYVTHLEARAPKYRPHQIQEMADFIRETTDAKSPILILGDLNTRGGPAEQMNPDSAYATMLRTLAAACPNRELTDLWPAVNPEEPGGTSDQSAPGAGSRIDYILFGSPSEGPNRIQPARAEVRPFPDQQTTALSDHSAVAGEFRWTE